jgi:hypothetical protein
MQITIGTQLRLTKDILSEYAEGELLAAKGELVKVVCHEPSVDDFVLVENETCRFWIDLGDYEEVGICSNTR